MIDENLLKNLTYACDSDGSEGAERWKEWFLRVIDAEASRQMIHKEPTDKEKQLIKDANERIKQSQAEQSKLVAKAQDYFVR